MGKQNSKWFEQLKDALHLHYLIVFPKSKMGANKLGSTVHGGDSRPTITPTTINLAKCKVNEEDKGTRIRGVTVDRCTYRYRESTINPEFEKYTCKGF